MLKIFIKKMIDKLLGSCIMGLPRSIIMASLLCKNQKGTLYIYGVVSYRRESDKKPRSKMTCLGKIDKDTNIPIYNDKYNQWMTEHGLSPETALFDYIKRNNKDIKLSLKKEESSTNKVDLENIETASIYSINPENLAKPISYSIDQIKSARKVFYGATFLLDQISEKIGLTKIITNIFLDDAKKILTLAYFNVIEHKALKYYKYFALNYNILVDHQDVMSQINSELLNRVTEKDKLNFFKAWSDEINDNVYLSLDTISLSIYSSNIINGSFEYNKQEKKLKQVNICLLYGKESRLPVCVTLYEGASHDVSSLISSIKQTPIIQDRSYKLVLSGGFYSQENINYLLFSDDQADFLISLPGTTLLKNELIEEHKFIFDNIDYAINVNNTKLFGITKRINWENKEDKRNIYAHIFIDPVLNDFSKDKIIKNFDYMYNNAIKDPEKYINNKEYRFALTFRRSSKSPTGYIVEKNKKAYQESRSKAGWFVLLSNCIDNHEEALEIYRRREVVGKYFDIFKNFMNQKPTNIHNNIEDQNKLFISFISMILISHINNVMKEKDLYKVYTIDELLLELNTIKAIKIDNSIIIDQLTKKVKDIFDFFKCGYPE
jgi:transposase